MSYIEGSTFSGHSSELTFVSLEAPDKTGSVITQSSMSETRQAYSERNTTKLGSRV